MKLVKKISALSFFVFLSLNQSFATQEYTQEASVYANWRYGKKMVNGDYLNSRHQACSHEFLPVGSLVQITNLTNNRTELVEVNGKSLTSRIELTRRVAQHLGILGSNKVKVKILVVGKVEESINYSSMSIAELLTRKKIHENQTLEEAFLILNREKSKKVLAKREYKFLSDFPQYEPVKFDSTKKKFVIVVKTVLPKTDNLIYKEKIIMN